MYGKKTFYDDPLIKTFFNDPVNIKLYSMKNNNLKAAKEFEERFAVFYLKLRIISYANKLTNYYSKDFDKKKRIQRDQLKLDQPNEQESKGLSVDSIMSKNADIVDNLAESVSDLLPSAKMKRRYTYLSMEKKIILHHFTFNQLNNKEIAQKMNCSPQNVSKLKSRALKELRGG